MIQNVILFTAGMALLYFLYKLAFASVNDNDRELEEILTREEHKVKGRFEN